MDGVPDAPQGQSFPESVGPAALYQVSAANRARYAMFAESHARIRRLKRGEGRSRGKRRSRLV